MSRSNGSLFLQEILKHGSGVLQQQQQQNQILKHGSNFLTEIKFSGFSHGENPENRRIGAK